MDAGEEIVPNLEIVVHITTIFYSKSDGTSMFLHELSRDRFFDLTHNEDLVELG